tara:strand:+ start:1154 stop:3469 length:2316 start_codon:yes stop_codon:yes gene_type:complete
MKKTKVLAHTSYIGTGGYNNHSRDFFRHLSKLIDVKVRNFTIGDSWKGINDECHNDESYINDTDKKILNQQTLWEDESRGERKDWDIYSNYPNDFNHNVNIVLNETSHYFFWDEMVGPKIGYNVWEKTKQPENFFNKWKEFDQLWVPSQWQAECTINQGVDSDKVKVVPEGVDVNIFFPEEVTKLEEYKDNKFKFLLFGRWDYRKSTKEIIETFLNTFSENEDVELVVSIDNGFSGDGIQTTEERLKKYGFDDKRIKVKHFPSREDYISYLKTGHVFLSCARSEGWNLPLIEAMACGTPSIYSECCGQMEFAEGKGLPVKVLGEKSALDADYNHFNGDDGGNYYEPDFEELSRVMRDAFKNYSNHKNQALEDSKLIHKDFNWERVAEIGRDTLVDFMKNYKEPEDTNEIIITYNNGPKVEIKGDVNKIYNIQFIDKSCNCTIHRDVITNNMWTSCSRKWFTEWVIKVDGVVVDEFNLENKKVFIDFKSSSIGDTIAWFPYVEEFRKKHNCKIVCHTFHNGWFKEHYPKIQLGISTDSYASYNIGWFYKGNEWDREYYENDFKPQPLQKTATDILGLEFEEIKPKIKSLPKSPIKEKYATISIQSTSQSKYWNHPTGWQQVVDYLQKNGYKVVSVDLHPTFGVGSCQNTIPKVDYYYNNKPLDEVMSVIEGADLHLGIGSGLSWVAWALNTQVVLISSFTEPYCEFTTNCIRIYNDTPTSGYFNTHKLDPSNWNWYPFKEINNMEDWYEVENITPNQVIKGIEKFIKDPTAI